MKEIEQNSEYSGKSNCRIEVKIDRFISDAPARAFLKQIKGYNAFSGYERCIQVG